MCVCVCVRACVRVCVYAFRIVSADKILRYINTLMIIIYMCTSSPQSSCAYRSDVLHTTDIKAKRSLIDVRLLVSDNTSLYVKRQ